MSTVNCPDCDERMSFTNNRGNGRCRHCDGNGYTYIYLDKLVDLTTMGKADSITYCNYCSTTGQCQTCGGKGYIEEERMADIVKNDIQFIPNIYSKPEREKEKSDEESEKVKKPEIRKEDHKKTLPYQVKIPPPENSFQKLVIAIVAFLAVAWFVFNVIIPFIILCTATVALVASFFKKDWTVGLRVASTAVGFLILLDYNVESFKFTVWGNTSVVANAPKFLIYLTLISGLVAAYLLIINSKSEALEFQNKKLAIGICLAIVGVSVIYFQERDKTSNRNAKFSPNTSYTSARAPIYTSATTPTPISAPKENESIQPSVVMDSTLSNFMFEDFAKERDAELLPEPDVQTVFLIDYNNDGFTDGVAFAKSKITDTEGHSFSYSLGLYKNEKGKLRLVDEIAQNYVRIDTAYVDWDKIIIEGTDMFSDYTKKVKKVVEIKDDKIGIPR